MDNKPLKSRNNLLHLLKPDPPNSFLFNTNYALFRPEPVFKYMKSPLSQKTRKMLEQAFIPAKILHLTKSSKHGVHKSTHHPHPIKIMKIEYKYNLTKSPKHKKQIHWSPNIPHQTLPKISHTKHNSYACSQKDTLIAVVNTANTSHTNNKHKRFTTTTTSEYNNNGDNNIFAESPSSTAVKPLMLRFGNDDDNDDVYKANNNKRKRIQIDYKPSNTNTNSDNAQQLKQQPTRHKQRKRTLVPKFGNVITHAHDNNIITRHGKRNSTFIPRESKVTNILEPKSIIDDYLGKTFNSPNPKLVHFSVSSVFHIPSFAIFGVCHGSGPNAFLVATTACHYFMFVLTNTRTYKSNYYPTSAMIEDAFTFNDYELIRTVTSNVDVDVQNALPYNAKTAYTLSYGIVVVIGNSVIHINRGNKVANITLVSNVVGDVEMITSVRQCKRKDGDDRAMSYEHLQFNKNMRYVVVCSAKIANSFGWKNVSKIICDEYKRKEVVNEEDYYYEREERNEQPLLSLLDKIENIYKYVGRIWKGEGNGKGKNGHVSCFSVVLAKCVKHK